MILIEVLWYFLTGIVCSHLIARLARRNTNGEHTRRKMPSKTEMDIRFLRRTIGSAPWLDLLDNEQWRVLSEKIMPAYRKAELLRGATGEQENAST